jgi:hypothetical protein
VEEKLETCDEILHEAARGVLVEYDRMRALKPNANDKGKAQKAGEKIYLSFQERANWPLFQRRVTNMMEGLMNAKMDLTLTILVFWVHWEQENRRT